MGPLWKDSWDWSRHGCVVVYSRTTLVGLLEVEWTQIRGSLGVLHPGATPHRTARTGVGLGVPTVHHTGLPLWNSCS